MGQLQGVAVTADCPECGKELRLRRNKGKEPFVGCSAYPDCKFSCAAEFMIHALAYRVLELEDELDQASSEIEAWFDANCG